MNSAPVPKNEPEAIPQSKPTLRPFPLVGVGASAGGLKAFQELLSQLPRNPGLAFVLIPHLAPSHESLMPEILSKSSKMPVREANEGTVVEVNHVYIIKPNTSISLSYGKLHTGATTLSPGGGRGSIDSFFLSLAQDYRQQAIGVILSGTAADGSVGIRAIKGEGGITFAQDQSAEFQGMPHAAIATGAVDYVLSPEAIARELIRIAKHPYFRLPTTPTEKLLDLGKDESPLREILILLEKQTGIPFRLYKSPTLERRIARRMALGQSETLKEYLAYLKENPPEIRLLHDELLIHVTSFFREPAMFDALRTVVFPALLEKRLATNPIRVWVPGCSTGEEAYSLAISLVEFLEEKSSGASAQIFGSDVSEPAIAKARAGLYPGSISADVSADRLRRFFKPADGGNFQISKRIRDMVLFARQDLTHDPPFSRLDILSCRNVLIYLGSELQRRVLPLFHYALRPGGFLILGAAESTGRYSNLFRAIEGKEHIYSKIAGSSLHYPELSLERHPAEFKAQVLEPPPVDPAFDVAREVDRLLVGQYIPAGIVVSEAGQVIEIRGDVGPFLRVPPGKPDWTLQRMVREGLLAEIETTFQQARVKSAPVRREQLEYRIDGQLRYLDLNVLPLAGPTPEERYFVILFEKAGSRPSVSAPRAADSSGPAQPPAPEEANREIARLRQALSTHQEYQRTFVEKAETATEELRSSNEEVLSANEELQSTNEELQTAKEELQSSNEELMTINDELKSRNAELGQTNDDLHNVLSSVQIPMAIVDMLLRIRRITPLAEKLLSVVPSDGTRRITDFTPSLELPNLGALLQSSIDNLSVIEQEVKDREGRWWMLRIRPYRTLENKIDGAVLTLLDIDELKRSAIQSEVRRLFSEALVASMRDPFLVLDGHFKVKQLNEAFSRFFLTKKEDLEGRDLFEVMGGQWDIPDLRTLLLEILPKNTLFKDFQVEREFAGLGRKILLLHARQVKFAHTAEPMILLTFEDITDRRHTENRVRDVNVGLEAQVSDRTSKLEGAKVELEAFTYSVAHDLRAPLRAMYGFGQALLEDYLGKTLDETARTYILRIIESSRKMDTLIQDLLAFSRLAREEVRLEPIDLGLAIKQVLDELASEVQARHAEVTVSTPMPFVLAHRTMLGQVLTNLVTNALKFVAPGNTPRIRIHAECPDGTVRLWVEDNGIGIAERHKERIFRVFERLNKTETYPGTGIGLAIVKKAIERMKGSVGFESQIEQGSKFWVELLKDRA